MTQHATIDDLAKRLEELSKSFMSAHQDLHETIKQQGDQLKSQGKQLQLLSAVVTRLDPMAMGKQVAPDTELDEHCTLMGLACWGLHHPQRRQPINRSEAGSSMSLCLAHSNLMRDSSLVPNWNTPSMAKRIHYLGLTDAKSSFAGRIRQRTAKYGTQRWI